jgi:hypothetical protein
MPIRCGSHLAWTDEDGEMKAFMKEKTTISVYAKKDNYRVIDFEISMLALEPNLKLAVQKIKRAIADFL